MIPSLLKKQNHALYLYYFINLHDDLDNIYRRIHAKAGSMLQVKCKVGTLPGVYDNVHQDKQYQ